MTTQEAFDREVFSRSGSSSWIGITSDCISEANRLDSPRTAMITTGFFEVVARGLGGEAGEFTNNVLNG
ncbi:hypothetical protein GCM10022231_19600 [Gordonia caeni]|uniref:Uncharacterized protein n=1 Tax=Gordonia caeni TaxID=1007097 RepID=A0ABP7P606_9ACTN